jgi:hypothetical protein
MAVTKGKPAEGRVAEAILGFLSQIPTTSEPLDPSPKDRASHIARKAARKACTISGMLALPPGPAGLVTILPDLVAVWRVQAQMVADIAGAFGQSAVLSREQMLYCLFKHTAAQAVRDLVVRVGERYLVQTAGLRVLQAIAAKVGVKVTQRAIATSVSRWLPVVGIVGVAGYAYYDTAQVGATAIAFFEKPVVSNETQNLIPAPTPSLLTDEAR